MTNLPEEDPRAQAVEAADGEASSTPASTDFAAEKQLSEDSALVLGDPSAHAAENAFTPSAAAVLSGAYAEPEAAPSPEPQLFQSFTQPEPRPPARIPHFGHLLLFCLLILAAFGCTVGVFVVLALLHPFGLKITADSATDVHIILSTEAVLYFVTTAISAVAFPYVWRESFLAGLQWRGAVAHKRLWPLAATSLGCAALAAADEILMPGPSNAPIEKMMSTPGAAWMMFAFGITIAPFFEEVFFRGFLLPSLCTAWDWAVEKSIGRPAPPLDTNGHPQWSLFAMIVGSLLTSIPFALLHREQQGYAFGPFLLLIAVSLVLCFVRLRTRSLAASTLVHAGYNFIIFGLAFIGTSGFRHFDKM